MLYPKSTENFRFGWIKVIETAFQEKLQRQSFHQVPQNGGGCMDKLRYGNSVATVLFLPVATSGIAVEKNPLQPKDHFLHGPLDIIKETFCVMDFNP